jgi:hypothetical protein
MSEPSPRKRSQAEILTDLHNLVHQIEHDQAVKEHQEKKKAAAK